MLCPTVSEELLFPSSSPSARNRRRFHQVQSRVADLAKTYGYMIDIDELIKLLMQEGAVALDD
jgi:hypothetical protein